MSGLNFAYVDHINDTFDTDGWISAKLFRQIRISSLMAMVMKDKKLIKK